MKFDIDIPKIKNRRSYPNIKPYQLWFWISLFKICRFLGCSLGKLYKDGFFKI